MCCTCDSVARARVHRKLLLCICLACVGHGRRFRSSAAANGRRKVKAVDTYPDAPLVTLEQDNQSDLLQSLLALNHQSAYNPSCQGCFRVGDHSHASSNVQVLARWRDQRHHVPSIMRSDESTSDIKFAIPAASSLAKDVARFAAACLVSCALFLGTPQTVHAGITAATAGGSTIAREVVELVDKHYFDRNFNGVNLKKFTEELDKEYPITEERAIEKSNQLIGRLFNPGNRILSAEQWGEKNRKFDSTGVGLNLLLGDNKEIKVGTVPSADSDAAKSGIMIGDVVTSINGKSTDGMTEFDAVEAIQDDAKNVALQIKPASGGDARQVVLAKNFQAQNPVTYRLFDVSDGKTGYVKLAEFNAPARRRVREAVTQLEAQGATRLVLDLRGNRGGELDSAIGIAGLFLDRPLVIRWTDAKATDQKLYSSEPAISEFSKSVPMQVWVNQGSVSAAEVLAAALHDNCRAVVAGGLTYGKGQIQGAYGLSNGGALIQTVASWKTPGGDDINGKGFRPDIDRKMLSSVIGEAILEKDVKETDWDTGGFEKVCQEKKAKQS
mmetsp:Transcript_49572/g.92879  ORF Transcript_49572/g.92879 Transcript_49572/m.92879 type:complete len:554 (-) Transcript_49572:5-1666(-)